MPPNHQNSDTIQTPPFPTIGRPHRADPMCGLSTNAPEAPIGWRPKVAGKSRGSEAPTPGHGTG
eukprot:14888820-Alexandrium_andersonii.AAC.1